MVGQKLVTNAVYIAGLQGVFVPAAHVPLSLPLPADASGTLYKTVMHPPIVCRFIILPAAF